MDAARLFSTLRVFFFILRGGPIGLHECQVDTPETRRFDRFRSFQLPSIMLGVSLCSAPRFPFSFPALCRLRGYPDVRVHGEAALLGGTSGATAGKSGDNGEQRSAGWPPMGADRNTEKRVPRTVQTKSRIPLASNLIFSLAFTFPLRDDKRSDAWKIRVHHWPTGPLPLSKRDSPKRGPAMFRRKVRLC